MSIKKYVVKKPEAFKRKLETLTREWERDQKTQREYVKPPKLNVKDIELMPELFQSRSYQNAVGISDPQHLRELTKRARRQHLDPIIVLPVGGRYVLVNGHHRLQAYKDAKEELVPVRYYEGSPRSAVLDTGHASAKINLNSSTAEKSQRAWELCTMMIYSLEEVMEGSGASKGQAKKMGSVRKFLLDNEIALAPRWIDAYRIYKGKSTLKEEEGGEEEASRIAMGFLKKLQKAIPKLNSLALVNGFAEAIYLLSPERSRDIAEYLADSHGTYLADDVELEELREALDNDRKMARKNLSFVRNKDFAPKEDERRDTALADDAQVKPEDAVKWFDPKGEFGETKGEF